MGTTLHTLAPNPGATRKKKRVGRGIGSGTGKTAGRGQKGQKARTGHHGARVGFEGGQMPMQRRLPKRGFKNPFRVEAYPVNLGDISAKLGQGSARVIDVEDLRNAGLVPKKAKVVKVLGNGDLDRPDAGVSFRDVTIKAHRFSKSALAKIEAAGGKVEILESRDKSADAGGKPAKTGTPSAAAKGPSASTSRGPSGDGTNE